MWESGDGEDQDVGCQGETLWDFSNSRCDRKSQWDNEL